MLDLNDRPEGAVSADGRVAGCYLHGLFAADGFRHDYLRRIRERSRSGLAYEARIESVLDGLADHLEAHLSLDRILQLARAR
jgi:adenosylcobyric acid synthase